MDVVLVLLSAMMVVPSLARPQITDYNINGYKLSFATADGISRDETGSLRNQGTADEEWAVEGEYSWVDPDGAVHRIRYTADKNGFRASEENSEQPSTPLPISLRLLPLRAALAG